MSQSIKLGTSLQYQAAQAEHVFLSLGDLLQERLFFHPSLLLEREPLDEADQMALDAILEGRSVQEFYQQVLAGVVESLALNKEQRIRVQLNSCDSSELASLIGGDFEVQENNALLGLRGVSRFTDADNKSAFILECEFIKSLREQGFDVEIVVPFVKTLSDAARVIDALAEQGLPRGLNGLKVLFGADTPSSALLSERLLKYFDGVAIDLETLAQLTLGVDMANERVSQAFSLDNEAVIELVSHVFGYAQVARKSHVLLLPGTEIASGKLTELLNEHIGTDVVLKG
ncbi:phosphoenolpyruvate synthase [Vibrio ishigakensis]|uniref:Phosphoenolpyruvate synthase n=1 Tax=Vibrio ishigakensis TaxID=1481914 RepID=A0A0B8NYA5_9VIBR|nr:putative PEP-binding protein [Vibrio ishigakensis]GAM59510.1 phosphoenolpyruvate synthase [Vibrio ishigakensis]